MGAPLFLIQIVEAASNHAIALIPGGGPLEAELVELCVAHIIPKGVGLFRTSAHVEADIRAGIREAIMGLKDQTRFVV